jgi:hypothetical protein
MGACDFFTIAAGKDLLDAYNNAVEQAIFEHGHDSYNGTISTTYGPPKYAESIRFRKWNTLEEYAYKQINTMDKWDCKAIALQGKMLKEYKAKHDLKGTRKKVFVFFGLAGC